MITSTEGALQARAEGRDEGVPAQRPSFPFSLPPEQVFPVVDPESYYALLMSLVAQAKERISLFFFYSTTNQREQALVQRLGEAARRGVKVNLQLDFLRTLSADETGSIKDPTKRFHSSSQLMLALLRSSKEASQNVKIGLTLLPVARSRLASLAIGGKGGLKADSVSNAMHGVQALTVSHVKLLAFDDNVVTMGANVSKSYFKNRQDRYLFFRRCPEFAAYSHSLIEEMIALPGGYMLEPSGKVTVRLPPSLVDRYSDEEEGGSQAAGHSTEPTPGSIDGGTIERKLESSKASTEGEKKQEKKPGPFRSLGASIMGLFGRSVAPQVNVIDRGGRSITDEDAGAGAGVAGSSTLEAGRGGTMSSAGSRAPVILDATNLPHILLPPKVHADVHVEYGRALRSLLRKYSHHYRACECESEEQGGRELQPVAAPVQGESVAASAVPPAAQPQASQGQSNVDGLASASPWFPVEATSAAALALEGHRVIGASSATATARATTAVAVTMGSLGLPQQRGQPAQSSPVALPVTTTYQPQHHHHHCNDPFKTTFKQAPPPLDTVTVYPHFQLGAALIPGREEEEDEEASTAAGDADADTPAGMASPVCYHFDAVTSLIKSVGPCNPEPATGSDGGGCRYHDVLHIGSGYLNAPPSVTEAILSGAHPQSSVHILTASPQTMDFAEGFYSDSVKAAYSLIEKGFFEKAQRQGRVGQHPMHPLGETGASEHDGGKTVGPHNPLQIPYCSYFSPGVSLYEYGRKQWTFHGKGIFLERHFCGRHNPRQSSPGLSIEPFLPPRCREEYRCQPTMITSVGSSNFGQRSAKRDLELQFECASSHPTFVAMLQLERECLFACDLRRRKILVERMWACYPDDVKAMLRMPETSAATTNDNPAPGGHRARDSSTERDLDNAEMGQSAGDITDLRDKGAIGSQPNAGTGAGSSAGTGYESDASGSADEAEEGEGEGEDRDLHVTAVGPRGVLGSAGPVWDDDSSRRVKLLSLKRGLWIKASMKALSQFL